MKLMILLIFILNIKNIFFKLDSDTNNYCFIIYKTDFNQILKIKYKVTGLKKDNVKLILKKISNIDIKKSKLLKTVYPQNFNNEERIKYEKNDYIELEYKIKKDEIENNYQICFTSLDNSDKEINFKYNNKLNEKVFDQDDFKENLKNLKSFLDVIENIQYDTEDLFLSEKEYPNLIEEINRKIKVCFMIKSFLLIFIFIIQFLLFLNLINKKFKKIDEIVINNNFN